MEIYFTTHFKNQKSDRADWIHNSDTLEDVIKAEPDLKWKLIKKGHWYLDGKRSEETGQQHYLCILNNLQVYCGVLAPNGMVITTTYPYQSQIKKKTIKFEKWNFPGKESYKRENLVSKQDESE